MHASASSRNGSGIAQPADATGSSKVSNSYRVEAASPASAALMRRAPRTGRPAGRCPSVAARFIAERASITEPALSATADHPRPIDVHSMYACDCTR
ncbi:hypothetical protein ACWCQ0_50425 [Streptomyces massasporeus]